MEMWRDTRQFQLGALRFILQLVCIALKSEMLAWSWGEDVVLSLTINCSWGYFENIKSSSVWVPHLLGGCC